MRVKGVWAVVALMVCLLVAGVQIASGSSRRVQITRPAEFAGVPAKAVVPRVGASDVSGATRFIADSIPAALLASAHNLGALNPKLTLKLILPLALSRQTAMNSYVSGLYQRTSPDYRHFLKPAQFGQEFGASTSELSTVEQALDGLGLSAATPATNHLYVSVTASVATLERVFDITFDNFRPAVPLGSLDIDRFFSATTNPTLPASLRGLVTGVIGLNDADTPQPGDVPVHLDAAQKAKLVAADSAAYRKGEVLAAARSGLPVGAGLHLAAPAGVSAALPGAASPVGIDGGSTPCAAAIAGAGYTAPQLADAYNFNDLYSAGYLGQGMSAALIEFSDYHDSNLSEVESCYGNTTTVVRRLVDGGVGSAPGASEDEAMLDISIMLEMLPDLGHLYVYEAPNDSLGTPTDQGDGEIDMYNAFVTDDLAPVISSSWSICEEVGSEAYSQLYGDIAEEAAAQGQELVNDTQDTGAVGCRGFPAPYDHSISVQAEPAVPWSTAVGGTDLSVESTVPDAGIHHEDVWNDSVGSGGGGQSVTWAMPAWQSAYLAAAKDTPSGAIAGTSSSPAPCGVTSGYCRMIPDLTADADINELSTSPLPGDFTEDGDVGSPGYSYYCASSNCDLVDEETPTPLPVTNVDGVGGWQPNGGTSAATPLTASAAVLWDQEAEKDGLTGGLGFLNPALYAIASNSTDYANDFNDITTGSNSDQYDGCTTPCNPGDVYNSGTGYDMASGLGSINAGNLGADLAKFAATLAVTPSSEQMYGYTSDPTAASKPGPDTTAAVSVTGVTGAYTAVSSASWLEVSAGTGTGQLSWQVDPQGLAAGTYTGTITIDDSAAKAAGASPVVLTVTYTVTAPAQIAVSPSQLKFTVGAVTSTGTATTPTCGDTVWGDESADETDTTFQAPAPTKQALTVTNTGPSGSELHYLAFYEAAAAGWLGVDLHISGSDQGTQEQPFEPTDGTVAPGADSTLNFTSEANEAPDLNQGTYPGLIQVVDRADPAATVSIPASLVLGTGAGAPTTAWTFGGVSGATANSPIQIGIAPGKSASFNLVLSDASATCGYTYSLGVANINGSEAPVTSPSDSFLSFSSPYLQSGSVTVPTATAAPSDATDTGAGNGYTPMNVVAPSTPGVYQAYVVAYSFNGLNNHTYGPDLSTGGPSNEETDNPGANPLGAPEISPYGGATFIPVCVNVVAGAATNMVTGATASCPVSHVTQTTTTTPVTTKTPTTTTHTKVCKRSKRLVYPQHPAAPAHEIKAIVKVNKKRVKTVRGKRIRTFSIARPKASRFTVTYVSYLNDGEVVEHKIAYNGCHSKVTYKVLHKPDRHV